MEIRSRIELILGDITKLEVDAIVNAANSTLLGGGGVDGAIHAAAGGQLYAACLELDGCDTGDAKWTKGFNLPAKYVIHTVGPIWRGGNHNEEEKLTACYNNSLQVALAIGAKSVAFPAISTGVYRYPPLAAAKVALSTVSHFLNGMGGEKIERVIFVAFDNATYEIYRKLLTP
ncbi:MAG: O-acetyl-ADP-ribose deacetylase [Sphaerochaetaceae bacterium]|jgi:O-acetyl-ADP-ribose deacetylase (regulator of RNase III)